jgi:integrase
MTDLSKKRAREQLEPRREPYWQRLDKGAYIGFRRGPDTWIARFRTRDNRQLYQALDDVKEFDDAKHAAEAWFKQVGASVRTVKHRGTVRDALDCYLAYLRKHGREAAAKTAEQKHYKPYVWNDPIAGIALHKLTRDDVSEWRDRVGNGKHGALIPTTLNRHVRQLKAGLNRALKEGHIGNATAWSLDAIFESREDADTLILLTPEQRTAIIEACEPATAALLRAIEFTGARPGELAAARVGDFDAKNGVIKLTHYKGKPPKPRSRMRVLGPRALAFFAAQAKSKLPTAYLFPMANGRPYERHDWADEIRDVAIRKINKTAKGEDRIPERAGAYCFRHAHISEMLQVHRFDPVTVAEQTGTSVRMIERNYFKLIRNAMADRLAAVG